MKTASERYIEIKTFPHYKEVAIPTGKVIQGSAEVILLNCKHGLTKTWIERKDI